MCTIWDVKCAAETAAASAGDSMMKMFADAVRDTIAALVVQSVTWWVHMPSPDVTNPASVLQRWMLPFTMLVATGGIMWQALLMIITRRGEPLINVVKGVTAVALWGAVAVIGTNLLLAFSDSYATWVLTAGLDGDIDALTDRLLMLLVAAPAVPHALVTIVGAVVTIAAFVQLVLLLFRGGAVIILTGLLQLAAAGAFTNGTSGWLRKVLAWHLALILYKPMAATIYAIAFMLVGEGGNDLHTWLLGVGMLGMTIIALPAMLRFLSWSIGGIQTGNGSMGMLAAAGAAGLHGAASLRGVTDHARDMERRYQSPAGQPAGGSGTGPAAAPPPSYTGPAGGVAAGPSTGAASAGAGTAAGGTAAGGAATGGAAAGGAAAGGAGGAAAATGPAAPVVAGVVMAGQATVGAAKKAAATVTDSSPAGGDQ